MVREREEMHRREVEKTDGLSGFVSPSRFVLSRSLIVVSFSACYDTQSPNTGTKQSARSNDPYSARPGGGSARGGDDPSSSLPSNQALARGPAAAAAAAIASAAAIAAPEAAYCELCDVRSGVFLLRREREREREKNETTRHWFFLFPSNLDRLALFLSPPRFSPLHQKHPKFFKKTPRPPSATRPPGASTWEEPPTAAPRSAGATSWRRPGLRRRRGTRPPRRRGRTGVLTEAAAAAAVLAAAVLAASAGLRPWPRRGGGAPAGGAARGRGSSSSCNRV